MNLKQFFDVSIKLQNYGYKIKFIDEDDNTYVVVFAYANVCSGLAFGGVQYEIHFYKSPVYPFLVQKMTTRQLRIDFESSQEVSNIDEAIDFIVADIQKLEEQLKEDERQRILAKLTQREREILGL